MGKGMRVEQGGPPKDDVSVHVASPQHMQMYVDADRSLSAFAAPVLLHAGNPHERLYIAAFDGTGNDKFKDALHATNVAKIDDQVERIEQHRSQVFGSGYIPGPGTQDHLIPRVLDGAVGYTHEARVEKMYRQLIEQTQKWCQQDPLAEIRVAGLGFSRGAEEVASFARLVHERGIQDPRGATYTYDPHGNIAHVEYSRPPLIEPGKVAQVVGLFDPVGTGAPVNDYDRRLPPSVISGVQIIARDEHRGLFKSDRIIDPGVTPDGRFLGVLVPGAHSDVGGGYLRNGLSIRSGNLMVDYLNALSDRPFLEKSPEPADPGLNVVHRSAEGMLLYRVWHKVDRLKPGGYNTLEAPRHRHHGYRVAGDPYNAEPRDDTLSRQFDFQAVTIGAIPTIARNTAEEPRTTAPAADQPVTAPRPTPDPVDAMIERLYQAALRHDDRAMDAVAHDYLQSPQGTRWWQDIQPYGQSLQPLPSQAKQEALPELASGMTR